MRCPTFGDRPPHARVARCSLALAGRQGSASISSSASPVSRRSVRAQRRPASGAGRSATPFVWARCANAPSAGRPHSPKESSVSIAMHAAGSSIVRPVLLLRESGVNMFAAMTMCETPGHLTERPTCRNHHADRLEHQFRRDEDIAISFDTSSSTLPDRRLPHCRGAPGEFFHQFRSRGMPLRPEASSCTKVRSWRARVWSHGRMRGRVLCSR
jgi:hypothetical protein